MSPTIGKILSLFSINFTDRVDKREKSNQGHISYVQNLLLRRTSHTHKFLIHMLKGAIVATVSLSMHLHLFRDVFDLLRGHNGVRPITFQNWA